MIRWLFEQALDYAGKWVAQQGEQSRLGRIVPDAVLTDLEVRTAGTGYDRLSAEQQIRGAIVAFARLQVGEPYKYGADGPQEDLAAWDCSELTKRAYHHGGLAYPDGCVNQLPTVQHRPVKAGQEQPGDVFFFGPNHEGIPHTGLYAMGGTCIQAVGGKVGRVIECSLHDVTSHPRYLGFFRHPDLAYPHEDRA